jgi:2-oxoacid:acceptor oxidoreductase gamma subunit (pyruvate/2-ketoisovalerate family)
MLEIRFHGRGGQGAVTASRILALAAFREGKYVISFPFFGTERRGAPVTSFTRIDDDEIHIKTQIYDPDVVVVLDTTIMDTTNVISGIKEGGTVVINSPNPPEDFDLPYKVATVNATGIAIKYGLGSRANPIVNTAILGAFAKATGAVSLDSVLGAIREASPGDREKNASAVEDAYRSTQVAI